MLYQISFEKYFGNTEQLLLFCEYNCIMGIVGCISPYWNVNTALASKLVVHI